MKRLSALLLFFSFDASAQLPERVTLDEALRIVSEGPRVVASQRDADAARADRDAAGAFANPNLSIGRARPSGGERTIFDANSQDQASLELPVPIFGQRAAGEVEPGLTPRDFARITSHSAPPAADTVRTCHRGR